MKKTLYVISAAILLASCGGKESKKGSFELTGTLTNATAGDNIYLEELAPGGKVLVDSAKIDDKGNFAFTNASPSAGFYRVKTSEQNFAMLVLDSTQKIKLTGDFKDLGNTYKVEGSEDTQVFLQFNVLGKKMQASSDSMQQTFQAIAGTIRMDSVRMDSVSKVFEPIYNNMIANYQAKVAELVAKNKSSLAVFAGVQQLTPDKYLQLYKDVDAALTAKYPGSKYLTKLHQDVQSFSKLMIGSEAPEINLSTPEGKTLALSSLRGKIVMIDFWASWCGPCRKENPNVVKMYKKYHAKGFEIFSVSLDEDKDKWLEAIKKDGLVWNHVSDLKGWQSSVCQPYGIDAIPMTILLDKEGKIIEKGLRGKALEDKLEQLMTSE